jgi:hypothetical protein
MRLSNLQVVVLPYKNQPMHFVVIRDPIMRFPLIIISFMASMSDNICAIFS